MTVADVVLSDPEVTQGINWLVWASAVAGMFASVLWAWDFRADVRVGRPLMAAADGLMAILTAWWGLVYWGIFFDVVPASVAGAVLFRPTVALVLLLPKVRSVLRRRAETREVEAAMVSAGRSGD